MRAGSYGVNGERSMFNNFLLDGLDNGALPSPARASTIRIIAVPPDSVAATAGGHQQQEARIRPAPRRTTINVASQATAIEFMPRSEFIRNTDLNAAGFFKPTVVGSTNHYAFPEATFNRNQYGFNLGGPILATGSSSFWITKASVRYSKPLTVLTAHGMSSTVSWSSR